MQPQRSKTEYSDHKFSSQSFSNTNNRITSGVLGNQITLVAGRDLSKVPWNSRTKAQGLSRRLPFHIRDTVLLRTRLHLVDEVWSLRTGHVEMLFRPLRFRA